jgi:hypothetical protein
MLTGGALALSFQRHVCGFPLDASEVGLARHMLQARTIAGKMGEKETNRKCDQL